MCDARPDFTRWVVGISPPLFREMARSPVSGTKFPEERFLNVAEPHAGDRTARVESTPRRRRGQDRRLARQRGEGSETVLRIGIRDRSHEGLGVRMQGFFEHVLDGAEFDELKTALRAAPRRAQQAPRPA